MDCRYRDDELTEWFLGELPRASEYGLPACLPIRKRIRRHPLACLPLRLLQTDARREGPYVFFPYIHIRDLVIARATMLTWCLPSAATDFYMAQKGQLHGAICHGRRGVGNASPVCFPLFFTLVIFKFILNRVVV